MHLVVFEDSCWGDFAPFALMRPVFSLMSGTMTLLERLVRQLQPSHLSLWTRPELAAYTAERIASETHRPTRVNTPLDDQPALLVNARAILPADFALPTLGTTARDSAGRLLVAHVRQPGLSPGDALHDSTAWQSLRHLPSDAPAMQSLASPVDLILHNDEAIRRDLSLLKHAVAAPPAGPWHLLNSQQIWLGHDVTLMPGAVIDASKGPVSIGDGATLSHNAVLIGPCAIGAGSTVMPHATIRSGVTIGPSCKVGGEVSLSIFDAFSNKAHDGFVGHSYIGQWVNLGAGTTTSNLKNTYGDIALHRGSTQVAGGLRFLGSLIGDHSKTGIVSRLMGGTYIGACSMLAGAGFAPKFVPSFTFWTDQKSEPYDLEKGLEVARRMSARRSREFSAAEEKAFRFASASAPLFER